MDRLTNSPENNILIFDPIPFSGGSKKAINNIINLLPKENINITIFTSNLSDWNNIDRQKLRKIKVLEPQFLINAEMGMLYFIRHFLLAIQLLLLQLFSKRFSLLIGTSGPGVDLSLYFFKALIGTELCQFIQGPIATSNTIARCLLVADKICYLVSAKPSVNDCLTRFLSKNKKQSKSQISLLSQPHCFELKNGITNNEWPTKAQQSRQHKDILWAASLLTWKGLDIFIDALSLFKTDKKPNVSICYIKPTKTNMPISIAPRDIKNISWYEHPNNLDEIRADHKIFVSTSTKEPFGLSILEAMAAGLVVVIPNDKAYWDEKLTHGVNCYKYQAKNSLDLKNKLTELLSSMDLVRRIAKESTKLSLEYKAQTRYQPIVEQLITIVPFNNNAKVIDGVD